MSYQLSTAQENSKLIYINSDDATNTLSTDKSIFTYTLLNTIHSPDTEEILVSLYSCVIPYSFYNIRGGINNRIVFRRISDNTQTLFDIPPGNYTISSLGNLLRDEIQSLSYTTGAYVVSYDRTKMKYRFFATGISSTEVSIDLSVYPDLAPFVELGFAKGEVKPITLGVTNTPVDSEFSTNCPDVNGSVHQIQIRTNLSSKGCYDSVTKSYSTILGSIPIDVNFGGIIFQNPRDNKHKILISTDKIQSITLRITDDKGRAVNLNGLSFQVAIQVDFVAKEKPILPMDRVERRIVENHHYLKKKTKSPEVGRPKKIN
mgnify:CR=1 FL=1